jgi:hypothetical protein
MWQKCWLHKKGIPTETLETVTEELSVNTKKMLEYLESLIFHKRVDFSEALANIYHSTWYHVLQISSLQFVFCLHVVIAVLSCRNKVVQKKII